MTRAKQQFEAEIEKKAKIIDGNSQFYLVHPHEKNDSFTVQTQLDMKDPMRFPNVDKKSLIDALKQQGDLDAYAEVVFGSDLESYLDNGYEVLLFYRTMDGIALEIAMRSDPAPLNHRLVVDTGDFCKSLGIDESQLEDHELYVTLADFMKRKASENVPVAVQAYKRVNDNYLVHLKEEVEDNEFTFESVAGSDLARVLMTKEEDLQSVMNETVFEVEKDENGLQYVDLELPQPATLKNLIDKGGKIVEAEKVKKRKSTRSPTQHYKVKVQLGKHVKSYANLSEETVKDVPGFKEALTAGESEE